MFSYVPLELLIKITKFLCMDDLKKLIIINKKDFKFLRDKIKWLNVQYYQNYIDNIRCYNCGLKISYCHHILNN